MKNKNIYELTNPQKSILFTEQFYSDTTVNNICTSAIIYEEIDETLLKKAIYNVVKQNDSFRIHMISCEDNTIKQLISDFTEFNIDVSYIDTEDDVKLLQEEEVKYKFEFLNSDLFKFKIFILKNKFAGVILTVNHIIADSWSLGLVIQDILKNYHCLKNNTPIESSNYSYTNYINLEEEYKSSKRFQEDKKYWEEMFQTIPEQATIPSFKGNLKNVSNAAERLSFNIDKNLLTDINVFCKENNISVFNFFITIFSIYIGRVSNIDDFVIGTPILNRINYKDKHTMGMFVNTVPIRVNNFGNSTFKEMAKCSNRNLMNILRHQKYSYNSILEDLRRKNENVPNLYNIIISYQVTKAFNEDFGNYKTDWIFNHYCANDFNIHLYDINDTGNLIVNYDYLIDKYSKEDVCAIHNRIMHMIDQILANNDVFSDDIEIVTEEEKDKILNVFNNTNVDYPRDKTIVDLFEEQVRKTPDNIAVVFEDKKLTYKELNEKANSLANYLLTLNLSKEDIISVFLDKSLEMIIACIATLKLGAAYLPIDINYPDSRVRYMLEDSKAKIILHSNENLFPFTNSSLNMIDISLDSKIYTTYSKQNLNMNLSPNTLAYIMYTSGSTGNPKGVMVEHKNIIRLVKNTNYIKFNNSDRILQTGSIVFDACTFEIWGALLNGLQLHLITKDDLLNAISLKNFINKNKITILWLTSPLFNKLCEDDPTIFNNVRLLLTGGDVLSPKHINIALENNKNLSIINGYGPTENTTFSCCFRIDKTYYSSIPIGKPISNSTCYIMSKNGSLQPIGIPGELWVGGDGVSRGYLNNLTLTRDKFINSNYNNDRLYKTGDLVKWLPDGNIEFLGRIDNQVKIRGFRIELNEINLKILDYKNTKESYTTIYTKNDQKYICTYVVFKEKNKEKDLKNFLKKSLPSYMIPSYIVPINKFTLNPNGKIDKNLLPEPQIHLDGNVNIIRNSIDEFLIKTLKNILNIENISIEDTFIDIGMDSLTAITLSTTIYKKYNIQVSVKNILTNMNIKELSDFISTTQVNSHMYNIKKAKKQSSYPLSSAQKRIYYAYKMISDSNLVYNIPGIVKFNQILDSKKVESAFNNIIKNNISFRTKFIFENSEIRQKIVENAEIKIKTFNAKSSDMERITKNFSRPFNLEECPILRVELYYTEDKKTIMLIDTHHIIMDGTSLNELIKEFNILYNNGTLTPKEIDYIDYACWENDLLKSKTIEKIENYWIDKFKAFPIQNLNLPYDFTADSNRKYAGHKITKRIKDEDFNTLNSIAKRLNVSPYILFISAFIVLLYKYTNQKEIIIGTPTANRNSMETQDLIGMFVNNMAITATIEDNKKFSEFIYQMKSEILEDIDHQCYPFDLLVKKLNISNNGSQNPLFDIVFTYQNMEKQNIIINNEKATLNEIKNDTAKFNLTLEIQPNNRLINLEYRTDLFKDHTIVSILEHYVFILQQLIKNIDIEISDINIITDKEEKLLKEFNNTYEEINDDTVISLFEKQVRKFPNNIALICDNKELTYEQLNQKSNSLANYLISNGINNNNIVCIMANRSLETIICMLGILKAGAAFLNLDPTYPLDRTQYYIEDSKSEYVLTQKDLSDKVKNIKNCINIDLDNDAIYKNNFENPNVKVNKNDLSYVIYTSGSTGKPKGVMLNQIGFANMSKAMTIALDYLKEGNKHTLMSVTSTPFDIFVYEIIVSLTHGLKVVMANNAEHRNPKLLDSLIKKYNVDVMTVTPSLMKINYDNREPNSALALVKNMVFGGEPLPEKFVKDLKSLASDITIYNIYGPSEITILSNVQNLDGEKEITVGPPIMNTQIHILDKNMKRVPIGVVGEIYISGIQVGLGYIGKPELTKEKFMDNPFGPGKIYRSGDIGRWTFDGKVQCLGRIDNQIKLRGLRIELGEIENRMLEVKGVTSAIVNKIEIDNKEVLCGYYVADETVSDNTIKDHLRKYLASYMIPSYILKLQEMPYTINRKIDRKSLPLPQLDQNLRDSKINIKELDSNEEKLLQIWKNILKVENINIDDNFFDLGGDSISAISMQIESIKYNLEFEYADIFNFPTIRQLAKKLPSPEEKFMENYNYDTINSVLSQNSIKNLKTIKEYKFKNLLLIGGTGYLGSHIIDAFMKDNLGTIYCLIRPKNNKSPAQRLSDILKFYYGDKYKNEIGKRIKILNGDLTKENLGLSEEDYAFVKGNIDVIINSGAIVKHYGLKKQFEDINVTGTQNIVSLCIKENIRLLHISTMSVSGFGERENTSSLTDNLKVNFSEKNLYVGQNIKGIYTTTKYRAEIIILEAISNGLNAQILRIGNITNRYSDGLFQKNIENNAFANRIKSFIEIGAFPEYALEHEIELTPVDLCANAIIKILQYNSSCNVFHIYNTKLLPIKLLYKTLYQHFNIKMSPLSNTLLSYVITGILEDPNKKQILSGIIYDLDKNKNLIYTSKINLDANFTEEYLKTIGFEWPILDEGYIIKYINYFKKIKFLD